MEAIFKQFLMVLEQLAFNSALQLAQQKTDEVNQTIMSGVNKAAQQIHDQFISQG